MDFSTILTNKELFNQAGAPSSTYKPTISVVIPTLNEADNLPYVLPRIPDLVDEVLLVDGFSTDETTEIAKSIYPSIRIVLQEGRGKGAALRSGFNAATGDIVVMLDADGSTDPGEIPAFVGALLAGADFVKGSRFLQGGGTADMPLYRKLGNWAFVMMVRLLFGGKYSDLCYGYNAFWARILPLLDLDGDGFEIETMMNVQALNVGLNIVEVASFEAERIHGVGGLRAIPDGWRVIKTILREWSKECKVRRPQIRRRQTGAEIYIPAMQLLFREALYLSRHCHELPDETYEWSVKVIKAACNALRQLEVTSSKDQFFQGRCQGDCENCRMWLFLHCAKRLTTTADVTLSASG